MISTLSKSELQSPTSLASIQVKTPKRILHFSDGIMEEYSSDDEIDRQNKNNTEVNCQFEFNYNCVWLSVTHTFSF